MMLEHAADDLLAVFSLHLGPLGFLVDGGLSLLVQDGNGVQFQGFDAVVIGIDERMSHRLDVNFLAHTAIVHELVILFDLDAVGQRPRFGPPTGFLVGECGFEPVEGLVVAIYGHRQSADVFFGLCYQRVLGR